MKKIYIGNLAYKASEQDLESLFSQFGPIQSINLVRDRFTEQSKGFAFIEFEQDDAVDQALTLNGQELLGRPMRVNLAKEKSRTGGGSGSGGGGREQGNRSSGGGRGGSRW